VRFDKDFNTVRPLKLKLEENGVSACAGRARAQALGAGLFRSSKRRERRAPGVAGFCGLTLLLVAVNGCLTLSRPLPQVNLTGPGWMVRQGQAVWKLPGGKHDIAGDVLVATGPEGSSFVQFSKSPFPLVIGQTTSNRWQVEFPAQNKRYSGPGSPPKRLIWLYLSRMLSGNTPPRGWTWTNSESNWRLQNPATGEEVEGFFAQ
jgi:hypothetical protein